MLNAFVAGVLLTMAGCASTEKAEKPTNVDKIAVIKFNLPQQLQWKQVKSQQKDGNALMEWIPQNNDSSNTPVKVIYQRLVSDKSAVDFAKLGIQPLQKSCSDLKVSQLGAISTYKNKVNVEVLCSKLGKNKFGTATYLSVFADGSANHLLISEVKLPESNKAGTINPKNAKERQWAQTASVLAKLMQQLNANAVVCDTNKNCQ